VLLPAFSPDGAEITYTREVWYPTRGAYGYDLFTVPSSGGAPVQDTATENYDESDAAYSSVKTIAYDGGSPPEIRTLNTGGGSNAPLHRPLPNHRMARQYRFSMAARPPQRWT